MKKKTVTLPVGNKKIFEKLAKIAWRVELESSSGFDDDEDDRREFYESVVQELGKDAFLYSFTPSGEIGDGLHTLDNPQSPRISKKFYEEAMESIFGVKGEMTKYFRLSNPTDAVQKDRMRRFKSAVVALIQLYLESSLRLTIRNKIPKDATPEEKERLKKDPFTSFNYPRKGNQSDDAWYAELVKVEMHRYTRLFVASIFFSSITKLFMLKIDDFAKAIIAQDMVGTKNLPTPQKKFRKLRNVENRQKFVEKVLEAFNVGVTDPTKRRSSQKKTLEQPSLQEQMDILTKKVKE